MSNTTETFIKHETPYGVVTEYSITYLDGVAYTGYKPYTSHFYTATKDGKTSQSYHAKGYAINWLKRMAKA